MTPRRSNPGRDFFWIDNCVIDRIGRQVGVNGIAVYCALARACNRQTGRAYGMTYKRISWLCGCSEATTKRVIPRLAEAGLLERVSRAGHETEFFLLEIARPRQLPDNPDQDATDVGHGDTTSDHTDPTNNETRSTNKTNYKNNSSEPITVQKDTRHDAIRQYIIELYESRNRVSSCPWDGSEGAALKKLLNSHPQLRVEEALRCVENFFDSVVNTAMRPRRWIPKLLEYASGPVDEYCKPLYTTGEIIRRRVYLR